MNEPHKCMSAATEGPYAWRCCDRNFPHIYGIVTDRRVTADAWRESGIEFQALYPGGAQQPSRPDTEALRSRLPTYVSNWSREVAQEIWDDVTDEHPEARTYAIARWVDALAAQPPAAPVEPTRCAECSCEKGAEECKWMAPISPSSAGTGVVAWRVKPSDASVLHGITDQPEVAEIWREAGCDVEPLKLAEPQTLSRDERHAVEHARHQVDQASTVNPDCCFDYDLVKDLVRAIDRAYPVSRPKCGGGQ
jgi:hypothetical protein